VEELPRHIGVPLEVAVGGDPPVQRWRALGWSVIEAPAASATPAIYRSYIQQSRGELSVAKNVYVATGSGWFSCRSICYLAAGRPVVVQDTGFARFLPTGCGLVAFTTLDEAARGLEAVEKNYAEHQEAARQIARTYFSSERVLGDMLERIGLG
jgi:hypothetical protein